MKTVRLNNKGFTLIEVMIATFSLTIGLLGLLSLATMAVEKNFLNALRDEAVVIAEEQMNTLKMGNWATTAGWSNPCPTQNRTFRGFTITYTVCSRITGISADGNTRSVDVVVGWDYKGSGTKAPTNNQYQHSINTIVRL